MMPVLQLSQFVVHHYEIFRVGRCFLAFMVVKGIKKEVPIPKQHYYSLFTHNECYNWPGDSRNHSNQCNNHHYYVISSTFR